MSLYTTLRYMHPDLYPLVDYVLSSAEGSDSIVQWITTKYPEPTATDITNNTTAADLSWAQSAKIASGLQSYQSTVTASISFTNAAGVTDIYQADPDSIQKLHEVLSGYRSTGTVPTGFYWRSATNQNNPFTFADLNNLALSLTNRGWAAFQHLQNFKAQVMACTTITCVQGVTW